jgi:dihydroneopterin aldolase
MARFTIQLEELCVEMFLGIHAFEQEAMQRVLVSVEAEAEVAGPGSAVLFDYDHVADFIRGFAGQRMATQEELVMRIHAFVMAMEGAIAARVSSKKPDVYRDARAVGVSYAGG